jgi:dipeptidase E
MRALLLSNSTNPGEAELAHAHEAIRSCLDGARTLVFVPYALADHDASTALSRDALRGIVDVVGAHTLSLEDLSAADAFYVGGGNTFRLLARLQETGLLDLLRERARAGIPYIGASAGSCIAGLSIRTTNDMPIVEPRGFTALGLVPWHLNCHYLDADPGPRRFMGETREERLVQFLEENESPVVCLREGAWLEVTDEGIELGGRGGGKFYRRGSEPRELATGVRLGPETAGRAPAAD